MTENETETESKTTAQMSLRAPDTTVITGAAGWLGSGLVAALTDDEGPYRRSGRLRLLVRDVASADAVVAGNAALDPADVIVGDLSDADDVDRLFADVGETVDVIHTAGVIHPDTIADFEAINHQGTRHVLRAAERIGTRRVVHVSSNSPFGTNPSRSDTFRNDEPYHPYLGYGSSKMDAELAVLDAARDGLDVVMVRPPWFYGPHQPARQTTFFTLVRTGRFPVLGDGGQRRSMVFIDNLVQGIVRAELTPTPAGRGWWIADDHAYTVTEIVETVGRALRDEGFEVKPNRLRLPHVAGTVAERIDRVLQGSGRYNQQLHVLGEMNKTIAVDISTARAELGYAPDVELYEGMRRSIRWCLDQGIEL